MVRLYSTVAVLISAAIGLGAAELALRSLGYAPWRPLKVSADEPTMHEPDPQLGWVPVPGAYVIPPYAKGAPPVRFTILPGSTRATGTGPGPHTATLVLVGCSITQGWAVSDEETFAWRIQQRLPSLKVLNYGTGAYGTYQSLLRLERLYDQSVSPDTVVYGLIQHHEVRNVARADWLRQLALLSTGGIVASPYAELNATRELVRHSPQAYPSWPLHERLASVAFLEESYANFRSRGRMRQQRAVTMRLLSEMHHLVTSHGGRLIVALLSLPSAKAEYVQFLERNRIPFVDCNRLIWPSMRVRGEGHPNGQMHAWWADCIIEKAALVRSP